MFIQVRADAGEAAIRVGPRDIVRTTEGAVMVLLSPEGRVQQAFVLQASENFRVPAVMRSLSLHALRGSRTVQQLTAHEWTDIGPDVATGSLMVKVAPGTTVLCYVGDDEPLWPRMVDYSSESISVEITPVGRLTSTPQDTSQLDAVDGSGLAQKYAYAIRMTAPPSAPGPISVQLALGGIPARATARVQPPEAAVGAEIFSVNTEGLLRRPDPATEILAMHRDDQSQLLGPGWSDAEVDQTGVYRRTTMPRASAVMPLARDARWIRLQALFLKSDPSENSRIRLRLNGTDLPWQQLDEGWQPYEWTLGPGLLRKGTNEMTLVVERMGEPQPAGDHPIPSRSVAIAEIVVGHNAR